MSQPNNKFSTGGLFFLLGIVLLSLFLVLTSSRRPASVGIDSVQNLSIKTITDNKSINQLPNGKESQVPLVVCKIPDQLKAISSEADQYWGKIQFLKKVYSDKQASRGHIAECLESSNKDEIKKLLNENRELSTCRNNITTETAMRDRSIAIYRAVLEKIRFDSNCQILLSMLKEKSPSIELRTRQFIIPIQTQ